MEAFFFLQICLVPTLWSDHQDLHLHLFFIILLIVLALFVFCLAIVLGNSFLSTFCFCIICVMCARQYILKLHFFYFRVLPGLVRSQAYQLLHMSYLDQITRRSFHCCQQRKIAQNLDSDSDSDKSRYLACSHSDLIYLIFFFL